MALMHYSFELTYGWPLLNVSIYMQMNGNKTDEVLTKNVKLSLTFFIKLYC